VEPLFVSRPRSPESLFSRPQESDGSPNRALNKAVGGAAKSAHLQGLAADFTIPVAGNPLQVARKIAKSTIPFDQLIHEYGSWVHLGISLGPPRRELLTIRAKSEGYLMGLLEMS
jgi:zinc D-Ala-D-Ala carboxypeptidase